jgi:hypothetical protein
VSRNPGTWVLATTAAVGAFLVVQVVYLALVLRWQDQRAIGLGYYGLSPRGRDAFKRRLRRQARLLAPVLWLMSRASRFTFERASVHHRGLAVPKGTCSLESLERALAYVPRPEDVFVATQMRCGTTWMQHLVYEVLRRGDGDLVDSGTTLYAVSPWLEARRGVPIEQAPLVGTQRPSRVIKTHLPASHCPFAPEARYIYVARHAVSCYASCVDFVRANVGRMTPAPGVLEHWFCSDGDMWWGSWPAHVAGWWGLAQQHENVLFLRFEDMKRDLASTVCRVAEFLGMHPLADPELARVVEKCGFAYMRRHQGTFEMHPPHILAVNPDLIVRGSADRQGDVPGDVRARVAWWCGERLAATSGALQSYPDMATTHSGRAAGA